MAVTTTFDVWNAALREIGSAPLADTVTANARLHELTGAWTHAIEHMLAQKDWGFARRRATLSGVSDTAFPPYTYRYAKPSDFLRKCWVKAAAPDEAQIDHAEIAAVIYGFAPTAIIEYVSDHADSYNPANWPPHFTRALTLYLASLVAPKLARAGADDLGRLVGQMQTALADADRFESVFLTNVEIAADRLPVMRRALEIMGQQLAGSVAVHAHADMLRWHMNRAWDHVVKWTLEQEAWNFATARCRLSGGVAAESLVPSASGAGIVEGYSIEPDVAAATSSVSLTEYRYGFTLPSDFLHKVWIKTDPSVGNEVPHQRMGAYIFVDYDPCVMEYVALNATTTAPAGWSASFTDAVAAFLALSVTPELVVETTARGATKVDANRIRDKIEAVWRMKLGDARMQEAVQQFPRTPPAGRFLRSRWGSARLTA